MQSLSTVQKMFKALKVLTVIVFVLKIVGAALSLIGGIGLMVFKSFELFGAQISLTIADKVYSGIVTAEAGMHEAAVACFAAAVLCACGAVCTQFLIRYFKHEQDFDGTPFTHRGADELKKVGIIYIAVQLGAALVAAIICAVCGVKDAEFSSITTIGSGLAMILLSYIFRHGADLREATSANRTPPSDDRFI